MFEAGEDFDATFITDAGPVGVLAEVVTDGDHLYLLDLTVYPLKPKDVCR